MAKGLNALWGAIIGGAVGLIVGIAVFTFTGSDGESLAIVDPAAPAAAIVTLTAAAILGAIIGGLTAYSRR